ncbi:MAG: Ig-like domain repeat protein [Candidatus Bathyarchaeia archaeon]
MATLILLSLLVQTTSFMLVGKAQPITAEQFSIINPGPTSFPSRWNASSTVRNYNTTNFIFYSNETAFDSTFFMNVTVTNVTSLFGWGIGVAYDSTTLQFVKAWLPTDNVFAGAVDAGASVVAPSPVVAPFNATYQEVEYGASFTPPTPPWSFNGTGTMAQVEFQVIAAVNSTNTQVSSSFTFDPAWTGVYFWPSGSEVPTSNTGNFVYAWAPARSLTLVVTSPTSTAVGSAVNCTATVTGSNPTGTVTWSTNSSTGSFSPSICTLSSGTCSTMYNDTSPGTVNINANYSGDSHNLPSNGTSILTLTAPSRHDVVVSSVSTSANVTQGALLPISVAVLNDGTATETSVVVNATADGILIGSPQIVPSLPAGNTTTLVFSWNTAGVLVGTYNVTVTVTPVPGQTDLSGISKTTTVQILEAPLKQYYLTVTSAYDSPSPSSGWFDSGTNITESVTSPVSGGKGVQYVCTGWNGTGSIPASGAASSVTFEITANSAITWNWKTQFQVTFGQSGAGSDFTGTVVTVDSVSYSVRGLTVSFWWDSGSSQTFSFTSPLIVNANKQYVWSSTSGLSTQQSGTLTVTASGSVVGNYATASSHQMPPLLSPWLVLGSVIALGLLGASVLFMFIEIDLTIKKKKRKKDANKSHRTLN